MQFTEIAYLFFLTLVFITYWLLLERHNKIRCAMLLSASYIFYGWWDWRFLILIIFTTLSTYFLALFTSDRARKLALITNIILNIGVLVAFKYWGFFTDNLARLFSWFGWNLDWFTIEVLVPVGISFYTFQAISYSVDVYRRQVEPCHNIISFATFIAYFPQLVAGPIERTSNLLPQIESDKKWNRRQATSGLRMILFGVVKKVAVADILSIYVDRLYGEGNFASPLTTIAISVLFSIQIYCDFSAYSEIARGSSRLLGIEIMGNFKFPYFSRNILEFWRRWHISLMLWFRDYVYIPLGGNRKGATRTYINIFIVFLLSGLWHGASWNFVLWGLYWAICYVIAKRFLKLKTANQAITLINLPDIVLTFATVAFGFYIFRCSGWEEIQHGLFNLPYYIILTFLLYLAALLIRSNYILKIISSRIFKRSAAVTIVLCIMAFFIFRYPWSLKYYDIIPFVVIFGVEWYNRNCEYPFYKQSRSKLQRYLMYWTLLLFAVLSEPIDMSFIYFQF